MEDLARWLKEMKNAPEVWKYWYLAQGEVRQQLMITHHRLYDAGDKAGKLLAWLSRHETVTRWVHSKEYLYGLLCTSDKDIAEAFAKFYA
ncbi:hypothetical protein NDU88_009792 [Pleurodeles waltl]|uniref:Uncharacterized protein n=1 Tax=Pleurodeles waltl TaxID=8319 RepID=A0AAV7QUJ6_PLEWA|nr:hypothetical protein NDU88_009792 [Pleurodeles waltl]